MDAYNVGDHVSPIGQPTKHGVVVGDENGFPVVRWDEGVVAPGTPNPISEAPGDLQRWAS